MSGRDPHEKGRVASSLELLFDLTFVVAFANAGSEMAHHVAAGHWTTGLLGFSFAVFAICWAWINFSWFASAFDTDDWSYRLLTMVQMIGVVLLSLGIPPLFASLDHGEHLDNRTMVLGYIVMRVAMVAQWLRVAQQSPAHRRTAHTYVAAITIAQLGWVALAFANTSLTTVVLGALVLYVIELGGPFLAETRIGGIPWHPHHIAERYGLLAIITLGEGIVGTVASLGAATTVGGWSLDAALIVFAGMSLTFGLWWIYFGVEWGEILHLRPNRAFGFGYLHIVLFGAIAAVGMGLHVAAYTLEAKSEPEAFSWVHISPVGAILATAIPVVVFVVALFVLWTYLLRSHDRLHTGLMVLTALAIGGSVVLAAAGVRLSICLVVLSLAPAVTVIGFEVVGHRHQERALDAHR